jgi:riboflavin kinase/FMN adenylyltransferase
MKVFSGFERVPEEFKGATIAMGAFDGLHLGHKSLLEIAKQAHPEEPLGLLLFEPPPKLFFARDTHGSRLATGRITEILAEKIGVDIIFSLNFDEKFASLGAIEFINLVVINGCSPKHIVVGHDFRFGKGRMGDAKLLHEECKKNGIEVTIVEPVNDDTGLRISSTRIKEALQQGKIDFANELLGHPWTIEGVVEHGQKLGRVLGFPTANIKLYQQIEPLFGIYAVKVDIGDRNLRPGVANFGRTPTTGMRDPLFEAFILDFDGDLYGRNIIVELHKFLRPEEKYNSLDELKAQIAIDVQNARDCFEQK